MPDAPFPVRPSPLQIFSAAEKLEAVTRELRYRRRVYLRRVQAGSMAPELARRQIAIMEAIEADYQAKAERERLL